MLINLMYYKLREYLFLDQNFYFAGTYIDFSVGPACINL